MRASLAGEDRTSVHPQGSSASSSSNWQLHYTAVSVRFLGSCCNSADTSYQANLADLQANQGGCRYLLLKRNNSEKHVV